MKILIAVPYLSPGSGLSRYVFTLCRILHEGNEIMVLTTHNGLDTSYEQDELAHVSPLIKLASFGAKSKLKKYLAVIRFIRNYKPDILINNYDALVQYVLPFIQRSVKTYHVIHNTAQDFYRIAAIKGNLTNGWIAPTKAIESEFNEYTNSKYKDRVTIISHGVDDGLNVRNRESDRFELLFVGMLGRHKGVHILAPVVKRLLGMGMNFHLTVIGQGVDEKDVTVPLAEEIKAGIVELTGVLPHNEVYEIMASADIFIYPTHCDAFGLVIAESMVNGAVPVTSLLPGVTDTLIDDGVNGYLVEIDNVDCFVDRIHHLMNNDETLNKMRDAAIVKANSKFTSAKMMKSYREYFEKSLNRC